MVGIVIVSHSRRLAEGVVELVTQMTQGKCNIAIAGGIDDEQYPIGTDSIRVMSAIEEVHDESGVLVLMDLGSALLSTEVAIELLPPEVAGTVQLCSAPIVEGAMAAAVAAAANLPIDMVIAEAMGALAGKQSHLGDEPNPVMSVATPAPAVDDAEALSTTWVVQNPHGIHARPAALIVTTMAAIDATIELERQSERANAKSLNAIAKLNVQCGDEICLYATGVEADLAVTEFIRLANSHFGESIEADISCINDTSSPSIASPQETVEGALTGLAVCAGIVTGPVVHFDAVMPAIPVRNFESIKIENARLDNAIQKVTEQLEQQASDTELTLGKEHAEIFKAHMLMLADPELLMDVRLRVEQHVIAEQAWLDTTTAMAEQYRSLESAYMREREADVRDIARQVMLQLCGNGQGGRIELTQPSVLLAKDLLPSDTAQLDPEKVLAICLSGGGKTSHSAILARAMGIPAIIRVENCLELVEPGQVVTVDGFSGLLWLTPTEEKQQELDDRRLTWLDQVNHQLLAAHEPAITADGYRFNIMANIGGLEDVSDALDAGAEGVGLLRTEFMFQSHAELPSEHEQYVVYRDIAAALGGFPLTIRSLDVGGDKPLLSYPMTEEDNPFLGLRGVRLCLADDKLFKDQLKAVLRAAAEYTNIQLMIPMIALPSELRAVKALILVCREELDLPEEEYPLAIGIMIEVPAAVFNADELAQEADFFSIGTNDLTQYVMAADRGNPAVAELVDYKQPAVINAITMTCNAGKKANIPVSMCGEMAGDSEMTELLLRLGVTKLSASASMIPALKAKVRRINYHESRESLQVQPV
ncbi:MAG: phosphoenolpyruvate--protein phosphotransferase [Moritella sp.]|uniref:phosphoenolpyruvate--protein phosphotransferase n=1 Tax=Moritella sp. TaxID=78556 RepID=UPI0025FCD7E0|nr:phosphoenolpyruvate--protein phosphotransferase [Moritella sp.]NQZ91123.1 phosphoenolpyruvate--protein phosphotransferase [Moritella sp.]